MDEVYQEINTVNGTLRGFLHQPDLTNRVPLVIMYHGFTGSKNSNNFLFVQFARFLAKHGIASLRFDFIGSGDSDKSFKSTTFSKELDEANIILDYAKTLPCVKHIIILGLSLGAVIATHLCKKRMNDVAKLILWSPAGNMTEYAKKASEFVPILKNGNYDLGGIELSKVFVDELKTFNLYEGIDVFKKPVAIFQGTKDERVPVEIAEKYRKLFQNSELHLIVNAGHTFDFLIARQKLFDLNAVFILNN